MHIIFLLVPLSLVFLVGSFLAFRFAIKSNQYEDLEGAANSIILDDREAVRTIIASNKIQPTPTINTDEVSTQK